MSQIFSEECIKKIKCQTYAPARHEGDGERVSTRLTVSVVGLTVDCIDSNINNKITPIAIVYLSASCNIYLYPPLKEKYNQEGWNLCI